MLEGVAGLAALLGRRLGLRAALRCVGVVKGLLRVAGLSTWLSEGDKAGLSWVRELQLGCFSAEKLRQR